MFSLLYGFYEYLTHKEEVHILVIGLDRAGKTTLLDRIRLLFTGISTLENGHTLPTVGLNIARFDLKNVPLVFWDLGGQAQLRSIWEKYYEETHAIVFVVDAADHPRLAEAKIVLEKLVEHAELQGAPLLVLANKQDLPGAMAAVEVRERIGLGRFSRDRPIDVRPCSAVNGEGLEDATSWLVGEVKHSRRADSLRKKR